MGLLIILIVGALIGWLGAQVAGRDEGILGSMVIGIIGAFIGGILSSIFTGTSRAFTEMTWSGIIWTFIGSILLVALLNAVQSRAHRI